MCEKSRQLNIYRTMLVYAGIRNTPKPLPCPDVQPSDEFWKQPVTRHFTDDGGLMIKDRILHATVKVAEEIGWNYDSEVGSVALSVNDRTSFGQLYGDWFITVMKPQALEVLE